MSIYKIHGDKFIELHNTSFEIEQLYEVKDLQKYLVNTIEILDPDLLVISTEFSDWIDSKRSIDILCVDKEANVVVIELKRTKDGAHMELQAIRYASMVANMTFDDALTTYERYLNKIGHKINSRETLLKFLGWEDILENEFAKDVKIILVSADFSKELTTSILWLNEREIDIRCFRIKPHKDGDKLYLDIQQIIPLPEYADYQVKLKEKASEEREIRRENNRAKSIIKSLFEAGLLEIGQIVRLKPAINQGHNPEVVSATIVNKDLSCLKRKDDNKTYSFSKLRRIWTDELDLKDVNPNWGFSLKHDWVTENNIELAELNKEND
jgi:hypothetical protein